MHVHGKWWKYVLSTSYPFSRTYICHSSFCVVLSIVTEIWNLHLTIDRTYQRATHIATNVTPSLSFI